jgi:hypothetical protein
LSGGNTNSTREIRSKMVITPIDTKAGRFYPWNEDKYVSVTTAIGEGVPKPGLSRWFIKNMAEIAVRNRKKLAGYSRIPDGTEFLMDTYYKKGDNTAAKLGTLVHSLCERISLGESVSITNGSDEEPFIDAFYKFVDDYQPTFVETEVTMFSKEHGYAGTADAIIEIDGKRYICDYKTGRAVYPEVALQVAAYRYADFIGRPEGVEEALPKIHGGLVLHIRPEGYKAIPLDAGTDTFDTFLSALDIFRWSRIDGKHTIGEAWEKE